MDIFESLFRPGGRQPFDSFGEGGEDDCYGHERSKDGHKPNKEDRSSGILDVITIDQDSLNQCVKNIERYIHDYLSKTGADLQAAATRTAFTRLFILTQPPQVCQ